MKSTAFILGALLTAALSYGRTADAQIRKSARHDSTIAESDQRPPRFSTGVTAGMMTFAGGRTEQAGSVLLQYLPVAWFSVSAAPGFGRTTLGKISSNGLTDIPLSAAAQYAPVAAPWSPILAGALATMLSTAQPGSALGLGQTSVAAGVALRLTPANLFYLSADASKPITTGSGNGSADVGISRSLGRATPSVGYSTEIGTADSAATLGRSLTAGLALAIAGPLTLAVDGSHGLTTGAPRWMFSLSFGTAFAGLSPISGGSTLGRLKNAFGSRASSSSGYSRTTSCKKLGTC